MEVPKRMIEDPSAKLVPVIEVGLRKLLTTFSLNGDDDGSEKDSRNAHRGGRDTRNRTLNYDKDPQYPPRKC